MFIASWGEFGPKTSEEQTGSSGRKMRKVATSDVAMTSSKTFGESTYMSWLRYFGEGEGNQSGVVLEALLSYRLSWFVVLSGEEDGLDNYMFLLANPSR